jgi:hypothetical protein
VTLVFYAVTTSFNLFHPYSWAKPENHHFTSALLTVIEANNTWIIAFSFNKGAAGVISSHEKKTVNHYHDLTMLIFIGTDCLRDFSEEDIPKLVNAVRNWVGAYITSFELSTYISNQHNSDSRPCTSSNETPCQSIVHNDQEYTPIPNSECANAWGIYIVTLPYTYLI